MPKESKGGARKGDIRQVAFSVRLPKKTHYDLAILSVNLSTSMNELIHQAVNEFLAQRKKSKLDKS
jgi:hypothetical protein